VTIPPTAIDAPKPPAAAPVAVPKFHLGAAPNAREAALQPKTPAAIAAAAAKAKARRKLLLATAATLVLSAAGFLVWEIYFSAPPAPPAVVTTASNKPAPPATTSTSSATVAPPVPVAAIASASASTPPAATPATGAAATQALSQAAQNLAAQPGQAVNNVQAAIAARRTSEQERINAMAEGRDPSEKPVPPPESAPPTPAPVAAPAPVAPVASISFRAWTDSIKISAVNVSATRTIAIINGRAAKPGDVIDATQGIVFESVDTAKGAIVFRDRTGATVLKKY
jgi:hypothetical protein